MYCKHCGTQLENDARFCQNCGASLAETPTAQPEILVDPAKEQKKDEAAGEVLKWGIIGLAFSLSCILSLLGWIFSAKARRLRRAYEAEYGEVTGRALVGKIRGNVGFGVGIGYTIFFTLYFLIIGIALAEGLSAEIAAEIASEFAAIA